jgi:Myb/SANT-like DNA-binding domain
MLTQEQKLLLSQLVLAKKNLLLGSFSPTINNKVRTQAWQEVTTELIANGAHPDLSSKKVRHTEWGNLQRSVVEKYRKHLKSGAEGTRGKL